MLTNSDRLGDNVENRVNTKCELKVVNIESSKLIQYYICPSGASFVIKRTIDGRYISAQWIKLVDGAVVSI